MSQPSRRVGLDDDFRGISRLCGSSSVPQQPQIASRRYPGRVASSFFACDLNSFTWSAVTASVNLLP